MPTRDDDFQTFTVEQGRRLKSEADKLFASTPPLSLHRSLEGTIVLAVLLPRPVAPRVQAPPIMLRTHH